MVLWKFVSTWIYSNSLRPLKRKREREGEEEREGEDRVRRGGQERKGELQRWEKRREGKNWGEPDCWGWHSLLPWRVSGCKHRKGGTQTELGIVWLEETELGFGEEEDARIQRIQCQKKRASQREKVWESWIAAHWSNQQNTDQTLCVGEPPKARKEPYN